MLNYKTRPPRILGFFFSCFVSVPVFLEIETSISICAEKKRSIWEFSSHALISIDT